MSAGKAKRETWKYTGGEKPHTVIVYEREPGGLLYARVWDSSARNGKGSWIRRSLGHKDKKLARRYADKEATKREEGQADITQGKVTLAEVFAAYLQYHTPTKVESEQQADERRAELWGRWLGKTDPYNISSAQWQGFIQARSSGAIDPRGNPVPEKKRKTVRARAVEADCVWLWLVFNWAVDWKLANDKYLMRENPVRGFKAPRELNPRRPFATQDRFNAVRAVSDSHMMEVRENKKRIKRRSYLSELLDIVNGTGRRIEAVCELRFQDLRLNEGPYGSICWPADTEKTKRETLIPISQRVRAAIDRVLRERPGIGAVPLFPSPTDPSKPMSRHLAHSWLSKAEVEMAKLKPLRGSLWHAYRRKWATERKHLPDKDVAAAGGWKSLEALKNSYQQVDQATMLAVVLDESHQLREAK